MLNLALSSVKTLLENIDIGGTLLIERYAGLTFPMSFWESVSQTESGEPIMKEKIFPVACGVTYEQCMSGNKRYSPIVPDSSVRSLAYWETMGDTTINVAESRFAAKNGLIVYDIPARFVFWANMAKLNINGTGQTDCSIVAPIMLEIQNTLFRKMGFEIPNESYQHAKAEFIFTGQETKDASKIFGKYSFGRELTKFLLYPFDFFSLRYLVRLRINRHCIELFTLGEPIDCPVITPAES